MVSCAAIVVATSCVSAAHADERQDLVGWDQVKAEGMSQLAVAEGWACPELVPGAVNTLGWEDSVSISLDGSSLSWSYVPLDLLSFLEAGQFEDFERYRRGPDRRAPLLAGRVRRRART